MITAICYNLIWLKIKKAMDDLVYCKNYINEFVGEYLKGDIYALTYFDFSS